MSCLPAESAAASAADAEAAASTAAGASGGAAASVKHYWRWPGAPKDREEAYKALIAAASRQRPHFAKRGSTNAVWQSVADEVRNKCGEYQLKRIGSGGQVPELKGAAARSKLEELIKQRREEYVKAHELGLQGAPTALGSEIASMLDFYINELNHPELTLRNVPAQLPLEASALPTDLVDTEAYDAETVASVTAAAAAAAAAADMHAQFQAAAAAHAHAEQFHAMAAHGEALAAAAPEALQQMLATLGSEAGASPEVLASQEAHHRDVGTPASEAVASEAGVSPAGEPPVASAAESAANALHLTQGGGVRGTRRNTRAAPTLNASAMMRAIVPGALWPPPMPQATGVFAAPDTHALLTEVRDLLAELLAMKRNEAQAALQTRAADELAAAEKAALDSREADVRRRELELRERELVIRTRHVDALDSLPTDASTR